jgi:hypothetical protein
MDMTESTDTINEDERERLSRRRFLRLGTVAGLGALLALTACGNGGDDDDDEDEDEDDD